MYIQVLRVDNPTRDDRKHIHDNNAFEADKHNIHLRTLLQQVNTFNAGKFIALRACKTTP